MRTCLFERKLWRQTTNLAEYKHLIVEEIAQVWGQEGGDGEEHFNFMSMVVGSQQQLGKRRYSCIVREWRSKKYLRR